MTIVDAESADLDLLANLIRETFTQAFGQDMSAAHLNTHVSTELNDAQVASMLEADRFLLAYDEATCLGFVQVGLVNTAYREFVWNVELRDSDLELRRIYVRRDHQNLGVGQALMNVALRMQQAEPRAHLFLDVWESNTGAQRLYARNGFERVGQMPEHDPDGRLTGYEYIMVRRSVAL